MARGASNEISFGAPPRNSASQKKLLQLLRSETMSSDRSVRARKREVHAAAQEAEGAADRAEEANADECALFDLMAVPGYCQVLTDQLSTALLYRFRVSRAMRHWIDPLLASRDVAEADVAAGIHVRVLRLLCVMENRVVRLARGEYKLEGDVMNAVHNSNADCLHSFYSAPDVWREGYGPLKIADRVEMIGKEGVVLSGTHARL